jgi:hypothetical protein
MYVIILLSFLSFLLLMIVVFILKIGGNTFRQLIKSKLPGYKNRGLWRIHCGFDKKVKFIYQKMPKKDEIKIRSGKDAHQDEYAKITEIYHQHDPDGTPVIITMDDLPFTFFLKKHVLDKWFPRIDELLETMNYVIENKKHEVGSKVKIAAQQLFLDMKPHVKHIPGAVDCIDAMIDLENTPKYKGKPSLIILMQYVVNCERLKELMLQKNRQFVNVYDLFKTTGFLKALRNVIFESFQNGFLAAQQTQPQKKLNNILLYVMIGVGVLSMITAYLIYDATKQITQIQTKVNSNSKTISEISSVVVPQTIVDTNTSTQIIGRDSVAT